MHVKNSPQRSEARAPVRLDLGGGWTDVPPYSEEEGGFVCNIAIDRYATAVVTRDETPSADAGVQSPGGESALATAALRRANLRAGGQGLSLRLTSDFPVGAGLGGSSAAGVASLGALLAWEGSVHERHEIAELSRSVEVEDLGVPGGRQDHYAAAFGGSLGLTFVRDGVHVERIILPDAVTAEIERRCVLLYTGQSRISGDTITAVLDGYKSRNKVVCDALHRMRELAREMAALLAHGSIDELGMAIGEHWVHQRALHERITTPLIDHAMSRAMEAGALGGKALGASGGGCVMFMARRGAEESVRAAVGQHGQLLPFRVDQGGLVVRKVDSTS